MRLDAPLDVPDVAQIPSDLVIGRPTEKQQSGFGPKPFLETRRVATRLLEAHVVPVHVNGHATMRR
jgi:hypothetical protein